MNNLGARIAEKRKSLGMTQIEFAEKMHVIRQTVSRWESGTAMPDIDKIADIASYLGVSCDYLLKDGITDEQSTGSIRGVGRLLTATEGKLVKLRFFDGEADIDLGLNACRIVKYEGNWMKVAADTKKGHIEKMIPVSSVCSIEICGEEE
jgi:transcriptional regulator with XRE-family HTH domain